MKYVIQWRNKNSGFVGTCPEIFDSYVEANNLVNQLNELYNDLELRIEKID